MKLTKKQEKIYSWLLEKPGYLKKDAFYLWNKRNPDYNKLEDIEIALKEARKEDYQLNKLIDSALKAKPISSKKALTIITDNSNVKGYNEIIKNSKIQNYDKNNTLVIADLHLPFCKIGYLEHCIRIRDKYKCGNIVLIGDEVDLCGVSQWEKDPDGFSAGTEASKAQEQLKLWFSAFPKASVCIGNHTARPFRQAKANGIPKKFMKSYEEAWEAPKTWKWAENWEFNNVLYTHGTGYSGPNAAIRIATRHRQNTVIGHIHSEAGIQYSASKIDLVWGMQLGGALDDSSYAAHYAKDQLKKSIVGCGVVLNGELPIYEPMKL